MELAGRFAGRKDDLSADNLFETPGYGVFDLLAHWNFAHGAVFDVGSAIDVAREQVELSHKERWGVA